MRTHEFADNFDATLFKPNAIVLRLRYYLRTRYNCPASTQKGSGVRVRNYRRLMTGKLSKR